jgi:5'-3' exonuclease
MENSEFIQFEIKASSHTNAILDTGKIALFDADFFKYHATYKRFKEIESDKQEGRFPIFEKELPILRIVKSMLATYLLKIKDPIIFCFSGSSKNTFRAHCAVEKEYKGNRNKTEDKYDYDGKMNDIFTLMKFIKENYMSLLFEDLEADDIVAVLQDENTYIISQDKDLKQVPGFHYNFGNNTIEEVTKDQSMYNLMFQMIKGDTTDNIAGIPGAGEKKAITVLSEVRPPKYISRVLFEYQSKFGLMEGTDRFVESWNLIKMRMNRGVHFRSKYHRMFDLKELLINQLKQEKKIKS